MLIRKRRDRASRLGAYLAVWLAALLAVAPFTRLPPPVQLPASVEAVLASDGLQDDQPATRLLPLQPVPPGILSRLLLVETALGPPPLKSVPLGPLVERPAPSRHDSVASVSEPRTVLERSSVGTARTPTGPPA